MPAKKTYEDYKKTAPTVPGPTCKYIDHVIDILIEEVKPMIPQKDKPHYLEVLHVLKTQMEYIRESNRKLRDSSDRKSTRLNSSHSQQSRMPSSA